MAGPVKKIPSRSDVGKMILQELSLRFKFWERRMSTKQEEWAEAEEKLLAYIPETEITRIRKAHRREGKPDYTTIQIPYTYAAVMSAHTYLTSVFMARSPVFQYSGRHGETQHQTQALEALIDYQMLVGFMGPAFYTWLYDGLKYGVGITGTYWDDKIDIITETIEQPITNMLGEETGEFETIEMPTPVRTYSGNRLYNIQPQDFIFDARLPMREFQQGEFAGRRFKMGWNELIRKEKMGIYYGSKEIGRSRGTSYYASEPGSTQLERPSAYSNTQDIGGEISGFEVDHPLFISCVEMVVEIMPDEWRLSNLPWPQKWVFVCTDDFQNLLCVCPLNYYHCQFPYDVFPMEPEGYGLTTRGLPKVLDPVQSTIDWLLNSHFWNVRAALNNKFVVDPGRIVMKDALSPLPGGLIRLKPEAYGTDTKTAVTQLAVNDVTQNHLTNFQMMIGIGERVGGVNDQIMGMLDTGGRKTATEVRTSTSFGINRLKTLAEFASVSAVEPLSRKLVQNSQQYFDMELQFKIAGDLMSTGGQGLVMVNPQTIAGFYNFVPVDGTLPIDRFAQVNLWKELFQAVISMPAIGMQYDVAGIFQWVAQLAGLKNITQFRTQVVPDALLQAWTQTGQSVPLGGPGQSSSRRNSQPGGGTRQKSLQAPQNPQYQPGLTQ
jgi:hypothetical protein